MRRYGLQVAIFLFLAAFLGFAWLTQHPGTPWLEKAQDWPLVGDLAKGFRQAYLGAESVGEAAAENTGDEMSSAQPADRPGAASGRKAGARESATSEAVPVAAAAPSVSSPTGEPRQPADLPEVTREAGRREESPRLPPAARAPVPYLAEEWRWFVPGQRIRAGPAGEAKVEARLEAMAWLPVLSRRGSWAEVVYRGQRGWIDTSWEPPHNRRRARRGLLRHRYEPVQASDYLRLKTARKILGIDRPSRKLGAYELYSDVEDEELLAFLDGAATAAEEAYFARYGRLPSGDPYRSVVLFATEADYRRYSESFNVASGRHAGHAGSGVLAFFAEVHPRQELARTLVHEIAHLLNDRAVARKLPPWLEEGMATDLGSVWVESSRWVEERGGSRKRWSLEIQGPELRFLLLGELLGSGQLPELGALVSLPRETFYQPGVQRYAYAHSLAFIRYLLDDADGKRAEAFRTFLGRIAAGRGANLGKLLGTDLEEMEGDFRSWLGAEVQAQRQRLAKRASELAPS